MQPMRLELDSNARRVSKGTALLGGSPFRLIRLSTYGAHLLNRWLLGEPTPETPAANELLRRLLAAGLVHRVVNPIDRPMELAFVVPVYDDVEGLVELLGALRAEYPESTIVVVDDCSSDATALGDAAGEFGVRLLRHEVNRGPAAARNTGWRSIGDAPEVVIFVDADVVPMPGAFALVLGHFETPDVAAAAPRVMARSGSGLLDVYEAVSSPLDLGDSPSPVRPGARVAYVPSAALAVRLSALIGSAGFDEELRVGEDVDFVWRLARDDHMVRYEPKAVVHHRNRSTVGALVNQRRMYGSAAAPLARRHRGALAPIDLPAQALVVWVLAILGGNRSRAVAAVVAIGDAGGLMRRLHGRVDRPVAETARLAARSHLNIGESLARAVTRAWLPLLAPLLVVRRFRRVVLAAFVVPPLVKWFRTRPALDPATFVALNAVDDVAYCSGVWGGAIRARSAFALLPKVRGPSRSGLRKGRPGGDQIRDLTSGPEPVDDR